VTIDNRLLNEECSEGLFLQLERRLQMENSNPQLVQTFSTARSCLASGELVEMLPASWSADGKRAKGK